MKSIRKFARWFTNIDWILVILRTLLVIVLGCLVFAILCGIIYAYSTKETETDFVPAVKYGEVDNGNTLFMTDDGNLYAFRAHFAEQNGSRFLMEVRVNDPDDPTDDELIELWASPQVTYDIPWSE